MKDDGVADDESRDKKDGKKCFQKDAQRISLQT
jgi:hypothetical protein